MGESDGSSVPDLMFVEAMRAIFTEGKHCHRCVCVCVFVGVSVCMCMCVCAGFVILMW